MKGVRMKHPLNPVRPTPRSPRVGHVETLQALLIAPAGVPLAFCCRLLSAADSYHRYSFQRVPSDLWPKFWVADLHGGVLRVEEQLLRVRDIFSTICLALGSHVHGLPSVLVLLRREASRIAEIAAIASARARRRVFHCLWPGWCAHVDSPRPSVRFNARVPVVGCLGSSRQGVLERTGPKSVDLFSSHIQSGCFFLEALVAVVRLVLDLWGCSEGASCVRPSLSRIRAHGSKFISKERCVSARCHACACGPDLPYPLFCNWNWTLAFCVSRTCCLW